MCDDTYVSKERELCGGGCKVCIESVNGLIPRIVET